MSAVDVEKLAARIEESAIRSGADEAECMVRSLSSLRIEVANGKPEGVRRSEETSAALRVLLDGRREGFAFTTAPEEAAFEDLARDAIEAARLLPPAEENRFSSSDTMGSVTGLCDGEGLKIPFERKVSLAAEAESAALEADERIEKAHKPAFTQQKRRTAIASGEHIWSFDDSIFSVSVQAVARSGNESQSGYDFSVSRKYSDLLPEKVGQSAAMEAAQLLGGRPPDTGTFPGVFPPKTALDLLDALVNSFSAEEMQKGRSRLAGKRGEELFSQTLTIVDDGTLPWKIGSMPFDDERVPPVPRLLVDRGVVSGCMHTLKTAARWGEDPTGNASRSALTASPLPGPSNLYIQEGDVPVEKIIPSGLYLRFESLMGAHMMDRVSGDFSLGAAGYLMNGDEIIRPFRNGTVSGNLFEMMASLAGVGSDLVFYGSLGSPTLLFESVVVSGS
jgi:PmbA protein